MPPGGSKQDRNGYEPTSRHINMAVEVWNYQPVPMETILALARERLD